jgi:methylglutaconyl-CoA hydratase
VTSAAPPSTLRISRTGPVASVHMARPEARNAFNAAMIADLTTAFARLGTDPAVRVIVLSGDGPVFCAGADLGYMRDLGSADRAANVADAHRLATLFRTIRDCPRPVVARVHGAAIGGGIGLVAASDIAVAAAGTHFAFSEVRLGLVPAVIAPFVLPRIGVAAARELFLTGEVFTAERALALGLVARVVNADDLDATVAERVETLRAGSPQAQSDVKRLVATITGNGSDLADFTADLIAARRASAEGREGLSAFLEHRRPGWMAEPLPELLPELLPEPLPEPAPGGARGGTS